MNSGLFWIRQAQVELELRFAAATASSTHSLNLTDKQENNFALAA